MFKFRSATEANSEILYGSSHGSAQVFGYKNVDAWARGNLWI